MLTCARAFASEKRPGGREHAAVEMAAKMRRVWRKRLSLAVGSRMRGKRTL
jgi:hypothetical protein